MGLPQLTFELKKAADTVAARATQGIAPHDPERYQGSWRPCHLPGR